MILVAFKTEEEVRDGLYCAVETQNKTCNVKHFRAIGRVIKGFKKALKECSEQKAIKFQVQNIKRWW